MCKLVFVIRELLVLYYTTSFSTPQQILHFKFWFILFVCLSWFNIYFQRKLYAKNDSPFLTKVSNPEY